MLLSCFKKNILVQIFKDKYFNSRTYIALMNPGLSMPSRHYIIKHHEDGHMKTDTMVFK